MNEEIEKRQKLFDSALQHLFKFTNECVRFVEWLGKINESLHSIDASAKQDSDDIPKLKQLDSECKTIENSLTSRQADIRLIKSNFQNYSNITNSFTHELHVFTSKLRSTSAKRMSHELVSELENMKDSIITVEDKYQSTCSLLNSIKDTLANLIDTQKHFTSMCSKFDDWLVDMNSRLDTEIHRVNDLSNNNDLRRLDDLSGKLNYYKSEINSQQKFVDDIVKIGETLKNGHVKSGPLGERFKLLEEKANFNFDMVFNQITRTRNLKENVDSTINWLAQIEHVVSSGINGQVYENLRNEIQSKKEILVKNLQSSSKNQSVDKLLSEMDSVIKKIDSKSEKTKLANDFREKLTLLIESTRNKLKQNAAYIDSIDPVNGVPKQCNLKQSHIDILKNSIELMNEIRLELNQIDLEIEGTLKPMLSQAETQLIPEFSNELEKIIDEFNDLINFSQNLNSSYGSKFADLNKMQELANLHSSQRTSLEESLRLLEIRVVKLESLDLEAIQRHSNELELLIDQHRARASDLDQFNQTIGTYLEFINEMQLKPKHKVNGFLKTNQRDEEENSNSFLDLGIQTEIEQEGVKMSRMYEWIGERLNERRKELTRSIEESREFINNLNNLEDKIDESEFIKETKFPIREEILSQVNVNNERVLEELNDFHGEAEWLKVKSKQLGLNDLGVEARFKNLVDKINRIKSECLTVKDNVQKFTAQIHSYEKLFAKLERILVVYKERLGSSVDLTEALEEMENELISQDFPLLAELNSNAEILVEASIPNSDQEEFRDQLNRLNNQYNILADQLKVNINILKIKCLDQESFQTKLY